jgi:hypothetical protein
MSDSEVGHVTATEYASRIRALLRKGGVTSGFPRRARDRWILLHAIARGFGADERLSEIEATQRIGTFLLGAGRHWRIDRVSVRRELVDEGFLDRDPNGADYRVSRRHEQRVRFEVAPAIETLLGD